MELLHDVRQRERDRGLVDQDHRVGQRHRGQDEYEAMLRLVLGYLRTLWDAGAPLLRPVAHAS